MMTILTTPTVSILREILSRPSPLTLTDPQHYSKFMRSERSRLNSKAVSKSFHPLTKPSFIGFFLLASLAFPLALVACQRETTTKDESGLTKTEPNIPDETGLIWEAWNVIKSSYVDADTLDSRHVVSAMVDRILQTADTPAYPFLTELKDLSRRPPDGVPNELADVWKAWDLLREKSPEMDLKILSDAAITGMLESLGGPSTARLSAEDYAQVLEDLKGTYVGIGANVGMDEGKIILVPMTDSPAERAGLMEGDVLLKVDGESVEGKGLNEVVGNVQGKPRTQVTLLVERLGEEDPLEIPVTRGIIDKDSTQRWLFPGAIGYIYITDFLDNTPDLVFKALDDLNQTDILALILDLRTNPGTSIDPAREVASQFLAGGLFMYEIDGKGERTDWPIIEVEDKVADESKLPMVVLVDGNTGGAAEVFAAALQEGGRAEILGARTFGNGLAKVYKELSDGSVLHLPASRWYTPSGRIIDGAGIDPDTVVTITEEQKSIGRDPQLAEAYDILDKKLPFFQQ